VIDRIPGTNEDRGRPVLPGCRRPGLPYHHTFHMVTCMKTTLNIDDTVMRRLREEAARRRTTMSSLVEAGLRLVLADPSEGEEDAKPLPPLPSWQSGGQRVDIANREELYGVMKGE